MKSVTKHGGTRGFESSGREGESEMELVFKDKPIHIGL